ncbi:MAG: PIN domain-containing protein [Oceanicaulis sp.]|uniref:type II toxin-antitoxin system VapC family toxin n=1 Tax=Glycocaulis sp. TaxID=1969725 RepID=UPI0025BB271D|nr:PIN domain-containing protein [Glycocaulis sp.]MCC5980781.1 PIN domain-containing protein [Oceanicaulis sp.]MCH8521025.1 PIN domain-containing protein [Glycocaulis sp.]
MILVDTSVWVDHLRSGDEQLVRLLAQQNVLCHPFIIGELALGQLTNRSAILNDLENLPAAPTASDTEVRRLIDVHRLPGSGIGYVDAHLAASALICGARGLWTRGKRLRRVLDQLALNPRLD